MIENIQLQMGVAGKPFHFPITPIMQHLKPNWITSVWHFVNQIKGKVYIKDTWELQAQHKEDTCLMDIFQVQIEFEPKELQRLNAFQPTDLASDHSGRYCRWNWEFFLISVYERSDMSEQAEHTCVA